MALLETLLEGSYNYFDNGRKYSEEFFKLKKEDKHHGNYLLEAESLTRTRTGEFLKISVEYNFSPRYETNFIRVSKNMGPKESSEIVKVNHKERTFIYTFRSNKGKTQQELNYNNYVHLATPCFVTTMLMTQMKKLDPVHRTQYTIYTSPNIWTQENDLQAQDVFVELQELEGVNLKIGGRELNATHCKLLQVDENGSIAEEGQDIYLSKYHSIPYQGIFHNGLTIEIEQLKAYENHLANML